MIDMLEYFYFDITLFWYNDTILVEILIWRENYFYISLQIIK